MRNISFIILTPMLGYSQGYISRQHVDNLYNKIEQIHKLFIKPDIVVSTSKIFTHKYQYEQNQYNLFRICENQIYHTSGECEQIRLCLNNIINKKIIIFKDDLDFDITHLKDSIKKNKNFIFKDNNKNNPGLNINHELVYGVDYALNSKNKAKFFFGDLLYTQTRKNELIRYTKNKNNINKNFHELVDSLTNTKPIKVIHNENINSK